MAALAVSSTSNTNFVPFNNSSSSSLRDASFSSYLNKNEETFMQKLSESSRSLQGISVVDPSQEEHSRMKKEPADSEIGVFGAERYFNGGMNSEDDARTDSKTNPEVYRYVRDEKVGVDSRANAKSAGTPSVRSESSWNSQNALLQNAARNSKYDSASGKIEKKMKKKSFLAKLGCKCSCSDENSVDVDGSCSSTKKSSNSGVLVQENASRTPNAKTNGFATETPVAFPAMSSELQNLKSKAELLKKEEVPGRQSLEVFGSPILEMRNEKKLRILPWSSNPRIVEDGFSTNLEDSGSDASSDLFEIESLTGKPKPYLARQESDLGSPTGYAPSEASIAWSVVTASAADFSAMSEYTTSPERSSFSTKHPNRNPASKEKERKKSSSSLLLGCKSQKAVRVSGDFHRSITNQNTSYVPRFQSDTKPVRFEARNTVSGRSIPHPTSHLLYTQ